MKVLLINGSPHQQGNTALALAEIARQLDKDGIGSETVWIGHEPVRGCIACGGCARKGGGACVFDDDICNRISERFAGADALVVGSPVYYGQPNGALLSVIPFVNIFTTPYFFVTRANYYRALSARMYGAGPYQP